jgi:hypothetical protein
MKETLLLPPWTEYPDWPSYSLGWRMGKGESLLIEWDEWTKTLEKEKLAEYFKSYLPIPVEWLDWVALRFGYKDISENILTGKGEFEGIHWLESQGLADFNEFKDYYTEKFKRSIS